MSFMMFAMQPPTYPFRSRSIDAARRAWAVLGGLRIALSVLALMLGAEGPGKAQAALKDGDGAFHSGRYRNLFVEQGHQPAEVRARIDATFAQLFHGDAHTQAVYYETGRNANGRLAYVTDVAHHDARSEGMSYGMMVAVQTNHKQEFDALWNWANTYMLITDPRNPAVGYYAWSMNVDGSPRSDSPAPDGEEYFVMSLYFAAHRWGDGKGLYNYTEQADRLLRLMRHHAVQTAKGPFRLHPNDAPFVPADHEAWTMTSGAMVDEAHAMIRFVPNNDYTDPSYHLPAFYELWARWGPVEDRAFWAKAAVVSRGFFSTVTGPATGLSPDYANYDGTPRATDFNTMSANFADDSWRTASNWSVDYAWWHTVPEERVLSDRVQGFFFRQGIHTFADRYTLDGKPLSTRHSVGLVATTATAGLAATDGATSRAFVEELWNTPVPSGEQRYFDGLLYMMSMLHLSGEFRIWGPR